MTDAPRYSPILSFPIRPTNPTPKHRPTAINPRISEPCKAATRGLLKLEKRATKPHTATIPPVIRLRFSILFPLYSDSFHSIISVSRNQQLRDAV
jgi:hypothetical protein